MLVDKFLVQNLLEMNLIKIEVAVARHRSLYVILLSLL